MTSTFGRSTYGPGDDVSAKLTPNLSLQTLSRPNHSSCSLRLNSSKQNSNKHPQLVPVGKANGLELIPAAQYCSCKGPTDGKKILPPKLLGGDRTDWWPHTPCIKSRRCRFSFLFFFFLLQSTILQYVLPPTFWPSSHRSHQNHSQDLSFTNNHLQENHFYSIRPYLLVP